MQKKTVRLIAVAFVVQVVLAATTGQARAQAEKTRIRPWLLLISI